MSIGYTKEDLKEQLRKMGFSGNDAVMVHSSMKALGNVEGGADTVVDAFIEFFSEGMFMTPTHTWKQMSEEYAVFDPKNEPACVGIIPNVFMKKEGVVRSLHPTHSIAAIGKGAEEYVKGEERPATFSILMPDGSEKKVEMYRHYNSTTAHISESFDKMLEGYFETGVAKKVKLGDAECILCDAKGIFEVTGRILQKEKNCFIEWKNIPREWYLV